MEDIDERGAGSAYVVEIPAIGTLLKLRKSIPTTKSSPVLKKPHAPVEGSKTVAVADRHQKPVSKW